MRNFCEVIAAIARSVLRPLACKYRALPPVTVWKLAACESPDGGTVIRLLGERRDPIRSKHAS